jgi:hypothetical protein
MKTRQSCLSGYSLPHARLPGSAETGGKPAHVYRREWRNLYGRRASTPRYNWSLLVEIEMADSNEGGIVKHYVDQFLALGVKNHSGENVADQVAALASDSLEHLDVWKCGTPAENKIKLLAQLQLQAGLAAAATPGQAKVLMDVHHLISEQAGVLR